jgi:hypothetical protein
MRRAECCAGYNRTIMGLDFPFVIYFAGAESRGLIVLASEITRYKGTRPSFVEGENLAKQLHWVWRRCASGK